MSTSGEGKHGVNNKRCGDEDAATEVPAHQPPISKSTNDDVTTNSSYCREPNTNTVDKVVKKDNMTTAKVTSTDIEATSTSSQQLSKNQMKKRRRMEKALEIKQRKKQQKKQVRYEKAKAEGRDIDAERIEQEEARKHSATNAQRMKRIQEWQGKMIPKIRQPFQICIDCSYESYMTPKEINSLAIQIRYCYSSNKRSHLPCQLTATSLGHCTIKNEIVKKADTKSKDDGDADADHNKCQTLNHLQKVNGFDEWTNFAFQITSDSFDQYFQNQRQNVVYLTSDSENTITTLENDKIYIIGGIVDRNRYKQLTYQRATSLGIATAKLPIDEYLSAMPSTRVLTTNHVFDLLIKYKEYNGCWKKALADVLPVRKDAKFAEEVKLEIDENEH